MVADCTERLCRVLRAPCGKPIEFDKGKSGIAVASAEKLPDVIDTLVAAVRNGELDSVLAQVKRAPMQKKKAA